MTIIVLIFLAPYCLLLYSSTMQQISTSVEYLKISLSVGNVLCYAGDGIS